MIIKIKKLNSKAKIPTYAYKGDAGMDVYSCEDTIIKSGERKAIKTGIAAEFPKEYVALVWDKGGIANRGITTIAGVIDSNYRGEWLILLLNTTKEDYVINKGDKIAQVIIQKFEQAEIEAIENLNETERGDGKFGSSGK